MHCLTDIRYKPFGSSSTVGYAMNTLTIKDIDDELTGRLKARAAQRGWSVEEEALSILEAALQADRATNLATLATSLFGKEWGVELEEHPPVRMRSIEGFAE